MSFNIQYLRPLLIRYLFQLQNARIRDAGGRYLIIIMLLFTDVIILLNFTIQRSDKFAIM